MKESEHFKWANKPIQTYEIMNATPYSYWRSVWRTFFSKFSTVLLLVIVCLLFVVSFGLPLISTYDPMIAAHINDSSRHFLPPSRTFVFGTDDIGNAVFDVVFFGTRTSLLISFVVTAINVSLGLVVGCLWGMSSRLDKLFIEVYHVVSSLPHLLIVTVLMYVLGQGFWQLVLAMCVTGWLSVAYFVRTQVLLIRNRDYNLVSSCLKTPKRKVVSKNLLPYLTSVMMTVVARDIPSVISTEVFLSFLGIGLQANTPSLGRILHKYTNYFQGFPHLFWAPVLILGILSISLYLLSQALADATNPKSHR